MLWELSCHKRAVMQQPYVSKARRKLSNKNKIAQGDVNIFSQLTFFFNFDIFATLTGIDASNRLDIIIFVIRRSISVEIDTSLALFRKKIFGGHFMIFF